MNALRFLQKERSPDCWTASNFEHVSGLAAALEPMGDRKLGLPEMASRNRVLTPPLLDVLAIKILEEIIVVIPYLSWRRKPVVQVELQVVM